VTAASVLIAAVLATVVAPQPPAPAPSSRPLKEIGHVRVSAACGNIVVHANSAISSALRNDATMAQTAHRLRVMDLESSGMAMQRGLVELDRLAAQLHDDATHGDGEVKRLRELADKTADPVRKAELRAFADSLGGALYRQKKAAADLSGFIAYLQYRDMRTPSETDAKATDATQHDVLQRMPTAPPYYEGLYRGATPNQMAVSAATDFDSRLLDIAVDEGRAADHSEGAVSGC
jgi:hypothetical protein